MADVVVQEKERVKPDIKHYAPNVANHLTQEQHYDRVLRLKHEISETNNKSRPPILDIIDLDRIRPSSMPLVEPDVCSSLPMTADMNDSSIAVAYNCEDVTTTPLPILNYPCSTFDSTSQHGYSEESQNLLQNITKTTKEERDNVETLTRGQRENTIWFEQRKGAFTASNFGRIMRCNDKTAPRLTADIMGYNNHRYANLPLPIRWGIKHEETAIDLYLKQFSSKHIGVSFRKTGLYIHPTFGYLRASPDGLVECQCHGNRLIEIKCPFAHRDKDIREVFEKNDIDYLDKDLEQPLKRGQTRGYFEQVTGQLAITGIKLCDFVIYTKKGIVVLPIEFDKYYWEMAMLPKLVRMFAKHIIPELLTRQIQRKQTEKVLKDDTTDSASSN